MSLFDELQKEDGIRRQTCTNVWGTTVYLRSLNADEMIDYADRDTDPKVAGVRLLVATIAEGSEDGPRIPLEEQPKYVDLLRKKDFRTLQVITREARVLNGVRTAEVKPEETRLKNESSEAS